ncbi:MAG: hypothetical protein M1818_001811 [Claussenomyces sp. TS43310]|nr:MAG: hypothetical protein M1818_001811 [Claussenomyces sp. TS43310]
MARSPAELEDAAPSASVRPVQGQQLPPHVDRNDDRLGRRITPKPLPHSSSSPSSSLLSRYLSPTYAPHEHDLDGRDSETIASVVAKADDNPIASHHHHHVNDQNRDTNPPADTMAMALPPASPTAPNQAPSSPSASSRFDMSDMRHVNSLLKSHHDFLNTNRGRGTSLERTLKEKRTQALPLSTSSSSANPGDTGMSHPPTPSSPSALSTISSHPPTDGLRAKYRSWRDCAAPISSEKAWSIGEEGAGDVSEGQVEKSIAEALAGIEPNNRSRKASHSLRFFREGLPEEKPKKREQKDRGQLKDRLSKTRDWETSESRHASAGNDDMDEADSRGCEGNPKQTSPGIPRTASATPSDMGISSNAPITRPGSGDGDLPGQPTRALPKQLLDDLRKLHNLTPAPTKGYSFSKSIPVTQSEQLRPPKGREASEVEVAVEDPEIESIRDKRASDDEESGEEQISSALFVPHQTSRDKRPQDKRETEEIDDSMVHERRDSSAGPEQWLVEHEIHPSSGPDKVALEGGSPTEVTPAMHEQQAKKKEPEQLPEHQTAMESGYDTVSDSGYTTKGEESSQTDDPETTPTDKRQAGHFMAKNYGESLHVHQHTTKAPLEAIELIPYRHQVGGHTTMWRFSKRAVCKQLNNRENEFYERVERFHPKLLKFMPSKANRHPLRHPFEPIALDSFADKVVLLRRYIGVLNVTFEKHQKRKAVVKEDGDVAIESNKDASVQPYEAVSLSKERKDAASTRSKPRMISQSISTMQRVPTPTVTFADNRHIIPKSFLQSPLQTSDSKWGNYGNSISQESLGRSQSQPPPPNGEFTFRPDLSDKHAVSWGATTVNRQLRYEVFGEAFGQPVAIQRHKKPGHQHRPLAHRPGNPNNLRGSHSESNLGAAQREPFAAQAAAESQEESMRKRAMRGAAERHGLITTSFQAGTHAPGSSQLRMGDDSGATKFEERAGTSAPEAEITAEPIKIKRKRRFSSGGLRRKPDEVDQSRGNLKYFEEADDAGYKGDGEDDVFKMDPEPSSKTFTTGSASHPNGTSTPHSPTLPAGSNDLGIMLSTSQTFPPDAPSLVRPVNPNQARTQPDKRVEFFLLLEDLTAGMTRPCIMDLKMGTRQYGVDANPKKQASQRGKCAETTSRELGVRVCGLQVWDVATKSYVFQDKYFGRSLKSGTEFQNALKRFLWDGQEGIVGDESVLRHIPTILEKLRQLELLIKGLVGYRFYAASLLMFYDGESERDDVTTDAEVTDAENAKKKEVVRRGREIDFKIADFANCITSDHKSTVERVCPPQHPDAPDGGFLRGLRSLRSYFLGIQKEIVDQGKVQSSMSAVSSDYIPAEEELDDSGEVSY